MIMNRFDHIPTELVAGILCHLDHPNELFHFILTCKALNAAFEAQRRRILSSVVVNAFGPCIQEALALRHIPKFERKWVEWQQHQSSLS